MSDAEVSAAMLRIQAAIAGTDLEVALNALSYQVGLMSVLGAESKGDALACVLTAQKNSRKIVNDCWGRADIELMRRHMRGATVQ